MGIGMTLVVPAGAGGEVTELAGAHGFEAVRIGTVDRGDGVRFA
jgi:phosphoribosylaminoimidazole (AIR) synthetase